MPRQSVSVNRGEAIRQSEYCRAIMRQRAAIDARRTFDGGVGTATARRWSSSGENSRERGSEGDRFGRQIAPLLAIELRPGPSSSGAVRAIANKTPPAQGPRRSDGWRDHGSAINGLKAGSSNLRSVRDAVETGMTAPRGGCSRLGLARAKQHSRPQAQAMPRLMNLPSASGKRASSRWVAPKIEKPLRWTH